MEHIPETLNHLYNLATGVWPVGVVVGACLKNAVPSGFSVVADRGWAQSREIVARRRNEHLEKAIQSAWSDTLDKLSESHAATRSEKDAWRKLKQTGEGWLKPEAAGFPSEIANAVLFETPGATGWQAGWDSLLNAEPPVLDGETLALFQQSRRAIEQQLQNRFGELLKQPRHREALIAFQREMLREILFQFRQDREVPPDLLATIEALTSVPDLIGQFSDAVLSAMVMQNEQQAEQLRENLQLLSKIALAVDSLRREMEGHFIIEGGGSLVCDLLANCESVRSRLQKRRLEGRASDLDNLAGAAGDQCYVALSGPSGAGKSALLAHWIEKLKQDSVRVCYHFFSREDDTARLGGGMACIVEQLLVAHRIRGRVQETEIDRLKAATRLLLEIPHEEPLVVVLDGLDEAFDESRPDIFALGRGWFPEKLGGNVSVVLGIRYGPGMENEEALGEKLGIVDLNSLPLQNLDERAIRALLPKEAMDVSEQIYEITQGLAIYMIRVVEGISSDIDNRHEIVRRLPAAYAQYVADSLGKAVISKREWLDPLGFLAIASAPLTSDELLRLTSESDRRLSSFDLYNPPQEIGRWLLHRKESDLWSFDHDATRDAWRENLSAGETKAFQQRLLQDCSQWAHHRGQYSLRFYVSDLLSLSEDDRAQYNESLFSLARDPEYRVVQRDVFPEQPDLPLQALRAAIRIATRSENIPVLAELLFAHARAVSLLRDETPLDAARRGAFERAVWLAKQYEPERAAFGLLMVAWHEILDDRSDRMDHIINELEELPSFRFSQLDECVPTIFRFAGKPLTNDKRFLDVLRGHCSVEQLTKFATVQATAGDWEGAFTTANRITDDWFKAQALADIASAQATADNREDALTTLNSALTIANRITHAWSKAQGLADIASAQATAGDREGALTTLNSALTTANRITHAWSKAPVLADIASAQATAGDREDALTTANRITDDRSKAQALAGIATAQATAGDREDALTTLNSALTTTNRITDDRSKAQALAGIATAQATAGDREDALTTLNSALTTANRITDDRSKAQVMAGIATVQATAGDHEGALTTLDGALKCANQIPGDLYNVPVLGRIATVQATAGDHEGALATLDGAFKNATRITADWFMAEALAGIATTQARAGDRKGALTVLDGALKRANQIPDDWYKGRALAGIATAQATTGDLTVALTIANRITADWFKAEVLAGIATAQATTGDRAGALKTLDGALTTANQITADWTKAPALARIATAQATAGDREGANTTLAGALKSADQITEHESKARALSGIAIAQATAGDRVEALSTIDGALKSANLVIGHESRSLALSGIATALASAGDWEGANTTLAGALKSANQITDNWYKARALAGIATAQATAGDKERALETLTVAHRILPSLNRSKAASLIEIISAAALKISPSNSEDFLLENAHSPHEVIAICSELAEVDPSSAGHIAGLVSTSGQPAA